MIEWARSLPTTNWPTFVLATTCFLVLIAIHIINDRLPIYVRGNRFLTTVGAGILHNPQDVAIDNRFHVYVTDDGRNTVSMFDVFSSGMTLEREWGGTGQALGQMLGPRQLVVDRGGLAYVVEHDNQRVQWFKPGGSNTQVPVSAWGVASPPTFSDPEGIAFDSAG